MRDVNTVFCHQHSHSQPRYPHFTLCPYCREDAPHEAIVVEAAVNYFSAKLCDFFIETELEIQMGADKRRADIVLVDREQNYAVIVECKRIGFQGDGIDQLKSYLCATATPLGIFANSTEPDDWKFFENLGRNRFKDNITSDLFWENIRGTSKEEISEPSGAPETHYHYSWRLLSLQCRERAEWKCEECGIDLKLDPKFLHAHHLRSTQYNQPKDLRALCISCHAEQPNHKLIKSSPDYLKFIKKYGHIEK